LGLFCLVVPSAQANVQVITTQVAASLWHPSQSLTEDFLPVAPCLRSLVLPETDLSSLSRRLLHDLEQAPQRACGWHVDLGVFPKELRTALLPSE
jgi:hypothetical protein